MLQILVGQLACLVALGKWKDEVLERLHLVITSLHRQRDLPQHFHWRGQRRRCENDPTPPARALSILHPGGGSEAGAEHSSLRRLLCPRERCAKRLKHRTDTARIFELQKSSTDFLQIYRRQTPE